MTDGITGMLTGRKILVTGVLTERSIAFAIARTAQEQGAEIALTSFGRAMEKTCRAASRLPVPPDVLELDVTDASHLAALATEVSDRWGTVDGIVHAIGFAPADCLGDDFLKPTWSEVSLALEISAFSLKELAAALVPLMPPGSSIVGLDFDSRLAWPSYNWMGVAKASLESICRYLARDLGPLGIRVNLVAAGPIRTIAAASIPGFSQIQELWASRAPLPWDVLDPSPIGRACVALLSELFSSTTGEIVHVDGGFHAVGA